LCHCILSYYCKVARTSITPFPDFSGFNAIPFNNSRVDFTISTEALTPQLALLFLIGVIAIFAFQAQLAFAQSPHSVSIVEGASNSVDTSYDLNPVEANVGIR
jgi:hypothetical protein